MKYEAVSGFFVQDSASSPPVAVAPRFGLLDEWTWDSFKARIIALNSEDPQNVIYKVFFLGRHGQGYHNVAESKYGTQAWDDYWSKLNGDGELVWGPDPELTPLGISQAAAAHAMWASESKYIQPDIMLSSPLTRAMRTWLLTFDALNLGKAVVVENCREEYGEHTCDARINRSGIEARFPGQFTFEPGFVEEDPLWVPDRRETLPEVRARAVGVLERIFGGEWGNGEYVSITAHGGIINALLVGMGREHLPLPTGGVLPVVVKCTKVD